jgi:hypothetical protein
VRQYADLPAGPNAQETADWMRERETDDEMDSDHREHSLRDETDADENDKSDSGSSSQLDRSDSESSRQPDKSDSGSARQTSSESHTSTSDSEPQRRKQCRDGPDHPDASEETLEIMRRMLQERGMKRFRLDLQSSLTTVDNMFCLSVARDIFVELLNCEEYDGLQPEETDPGHILRLLTNYAKEVLAQR